MNEKKKRPLIVLTGPTAVGKTSLSIALAKAVNGAVISADSMQVYKHMDIGSAKIMPEEMEGVDHYLIDVLEPKEEFNIVLFQQMTKTAMEEIYEQGKVPILVGGTGFYIQSVVYDIDFTKEEDETGIRARLEREAEELGSHALHERLRLADPKSAQMIHENNVKRVIRALEFYELTGTPISEHNEAEHAKESPYDVTYFVLNDKRELIYERIEKRVDQMLEQGLVEEVKRLREMGCTKDMVSMQGLGYKEILSWLDGEYDYERAVYLLKRDTRHFAKRQLTWFRREKNVIWVDKAAFDHDEQRILNYMLDQIGRKEEI